jgi:O-antigen biosynthesis protein WbqP
VVSTFQSRLKRVVDVLIAAIAAIVLLIPMLAIAVAVRMTSKGPALHWSRRVGRSNRVFWMPKFRSMRVGTPQLATHLLSNSTAWITPLGSFLRRTSLDELPQLWSILRGDMSFVGPRPALFNQEDLISLRTESGIHHLRPGLTGWAQINGRDELAIPDKVQFDFYYLKHQSQIFDAWILICTFGKVLRRDGIRQVDDALSARDRKAA